jgi:hypothetical protein
MIEMLLKSRLLLGVILIVYLSFIVNQYQSQVDFGDKWGRSEYLIGPDIYTSRDEVVAVQQLTTVLFILPFLIFLLKNRNCSITSGNQKYN